MSHNTFGHLFRVTTFGESHGPAIGCVVDGCPPLIPLSAAEIEAFGVSHSALGAALCQSWGLSRDVSDSVRARPNSPEQWPQERPAVQKLLTIGAAVDALLLNPTSGGNPDEVWHELEPVAHQVGLHFQAFQLATMRVCERLNIPQNEA